MSWSTLAPAAVESARRLVPCRSEGRLWLRQSLWVARIELRRCLWGGRAAALYILAAAPMVLMALAAAAVAVGGLERALTEAERHFAYVYQAFFLRWCVFFACVAVFTSLFRSEVTDRTLHYWLLVPCRRSSIVVGKYLGGVAATGGLMAASTIVAALLMYVPYGRSLAQWRLLDGPGMAQAGAYALTTLLVCIGYGALFLFVGIVWGNPIVPALLVLGWESAVFVLPRALKLLSVTFYLQSLLPLPVTQGPLAVVATPVPAWLAVLGLLAFSAVLLAVSAWRLRSVEVRY